MIMLNRLNKKLTYLLAFCLVVVAFVSYVGYVNFVNQPNVEPKKVFKYVEPVSLPVQKNATQVVNAKAQNTEHKATISNDSEQSEITNISTNAKPVNWTTEKAKEHLESFGIPKDAIIVTNLDDSNLTREKIIGNESNINNAMEALNKTEAGTDEYFTALDNYISVLNNSDSLHHQNIARFLQNKREQGAIVTTSEIFEKMLNKVTKE